MGKNQSKAGSKTTRRPSVIDKYLETARLINAKGKELQAMRPEVEEILLVTHFDDLKRIEVESAPKLDAERALRWLQWMLKNEHLTKEQFNSLFVKVLNTDAFITFTKQNKAARKLLPKKHKLLTTSTSYQIRPTYL